MKRLYIIMVMILCVSSIQAQDQKKKETNSQEKKTIVVKKIDPISGNPVEQHKSLSNKKSKELTSINTYLKKLQSKRKETLVS
ncbi:MAG: hypothetical protein ACWA5P_00810 [bacterium]